MELTQQERLSIIKKILINHEINPIYFFKLSTLIFIFYFWKTNTEGISFLLPPSVSGSHVNIKNIVKLRLYKMYFAHSQMNKSGAARGSFKKDYTSSLLQKKD